jgi:hypothetical protein
MAHGLLLSFRPGSRAAAVLVLDYHVPALVGRRKREPVRDNAVGRTISEADHEANYNRPGLTAAARCRRRRQDPTTPLLA